MGNRLHGSTFFWITVTIPTIYAQCIINALSKGVPFPFPLEMNPANLFSHDTDTTNLAPGETLFTEGDSGDCMYVLLEGSVDVLVGGKTVEHSERGAILGELALIDQSPRTATVIAKDSAKLAKVDERRFNFLISQNAFFATHVMKVMADRLRHMNKLQKEASNS